MKKKRYIQTQQLSYQFVKSFKMSIRLTVSGIVDGFIVKILIMTSYVGHHNKYFHIVRGRPLQIPSYTLQIYILYYFYIQGYDSKHSTACLYHVRIKRLTNNIKWAGCNKIIHNVYSFNPVSMAYAERSGYYNTQNQITYNAL